MENQKTAAVRKKCTAEPWISSGEIYHEDEIAVLAGEAVVCTVWPMGDDEYGSSEQQANARLIAAAPELLDALDSAEDALAWYADNIAKYAVARGALQIVRAAIDKAKGGAA